jgi:hypothetical protein
MASRHAGPMLGRSAIDKPYAKKMAMSFKKYCKETFAYTIFVVASFDFGVYLFI